MATVKLSSHFLAKTKPGITKVWEVIGQEVSFKQAQHRTVTNKFAITESIEHSRLSKIAQRADIDELVLAAIIDHGYEQVIDYLADRIDLVIYPDQK